MSEPKSIRADELLVEQGLCESRSQAKQLILAGKVTLNSIPVTKPGKLLPLDAPLILTATSPYVSRAGEKLEAFLNHFNIDLRNKDVLDIGASTGGFTDCVLQKGALSVTCVDVGHSQLHSKLIKDTRVTNLEKINARSLPASVLPHSAYDIIVMDLSFISLTKVLPHIWTFLKKNGILIALVKPQFEATKEEIDRAKGIIKDSGIHERIVSDIIKFALKNLPNSVLIGEMPSPLKGTDGNQEFLLGLSKF